MFFAAHSHDGFLRPFVIQNSKPGDNDMRKI